MRVIKTGLTTIIGVGLIAGSSLVATAQDDGTDSPELVTTQVEPGVERIANDGAGHDLDERHPANHFDMDGIAVTRDGTVWITVTASGMDNDDFAGPMVWAIGQPGMYTIEDGVPAESPTTLVALSDGTLLVIADEVVSFDGEKFVPEELSTVRHTSEGAVWLLAPDDLKSVAGSSATPGSVLAAIWNGWFWTTPNELGRYVVSRGNEFSTDGQGVTRVDAFGNTTEYLEDEWIQQIAAAPDGTIWAVGGIGDEGGGVYHITP